MKNIKLSKEIKQEIDLIFYFLSDWVPLFKNIFLKKQITDLVKKAIEEERNTLTVSDIKSAFKKLKKENL